MLRDVLLREVPAVLRSDLYAMPRWRAQPWSRIANQAGSDAGVYAVAGAGLCLALRLVGIRYGVTVPTARTEAPGDDVEGPPP